MHPGYADLVTPAAVKASSGNEGRPFTCCDKQLCTLTKPAYCICNDLVEKCSDACKNCEEVPALYASPPYNYICRDSYRGEPAPECTPPAFVTNNGVSDLAEKEGVKTGKESCGNAAIVARKMGS
ncbi:hypothetical protein EJB05_31791 [Eragrostis curvula]|uniref:Bowman-Birk serine protease inhibitors family domain-containing protein n=1 Tax=Eragrostis curvula TaxID=38414 RepID=A0A5J9UEE5_9POAL|nr:hypothetical protein EJB05_31791 [Eragrostis curvula]